MITATLLADLTRQGVRLEARGNRLAWDAPFGVMTIPLLEQLQVAKPVLLELVMIDVFDAGVVDVAPMGLVCGVCRAQEWLPDRDRRGWVYCRACRAQEAATTITGGERAR